MPIYEYRCDACADRFDLLVRSARDADDARCPKCQGKVARLLSTFAVGAASAPSSSSNGGGGMCQSVCAPAGRCMRNG